MQLLALCGLAGMALQAGLRGGVANAAVSTGLSAVVVALSTKRRLPRRPARLAALAALVPIWMLSWWASPWLAASNVAAATTLVAAALAFGRTGSMTDTSSGDVARRLLASVPDAVTAPAALRGALGAPNPQRRRKVGRVAVALLVCVPALAVVVALLASADAVFASLITPDIEIGWLGHLWWAAVAGGGAAMVVGAATAETEPRVPVGRFGRLEVVTMLALTAAVLAVFVASQALAATDAGQARMVEAGTTPADQARSGFFQLCWATGVVVSLLAAIRSLAQPDVATDRAVRALGCAVPVLALGLVAVSLQRMARYDEAFGLTMLRLWVVGVAVWMGIVLVLVAVRNTGVGRGRDWLLAAAVACALAMVGVADLANPEAFVARHNLERTSQDVPVDVDYLGQLSSDAQPTLTEALVEAGDDAPAGLDEAIDCDGGARGVASLNRSERAAHRQLSRRCATAVPE